MSEYDLPGPTRKKVSCSRCGQVVRDNREVVQNDFILCKPCAQGAYFREAKEIIWPDMNWTPAQEEDQMFVGKALRHESGK
jgi:formylmethanofuran dehydrogenase subunit E